MSKGKSASYYKLPKDCQQLQDVIESVDMNFAVGNIFKACYRMGRKQDQGAKDDIDKIIWYAIREKARLEGVTIDSVLETINIDFMRG